MTSVGGVGSGAVQGPEPDPVVQPPPAPETTEATDHYGAQFSATAPRSEAPPMDANAAFLADRFGSAYTTPTLALDSSGHLVRGQQATPAQAQALVRSGLSPLGTNPSIYVRGGSKALDDMQLKPMRALVKQAGAGDPQVLATLRESANDPMADPVVRAKATRFLGLGGDPQDIASFERTALDESAGPRRRAAMEALGSAARQGVPGATDALLRTTEALSTSTHEVAPPRLDMPDLSAFGQGPSTLDRERTRETQDHEAATSPAVAHRDVLDAASEQVGDLMRHGSSQARSQVLSQWGQDPEWRPIAAATALDIPSSALQANPGLRDQVYDLAQTTAPDHPLRSHVASALPDSPLPSSELAKVGEAYQRRLVSAIAKASPGDTLKRMGDLLAAKQLASHPDYKGKVDVESVDRQLNDVLKMPGIQNQLATIQKAAFTEVFPDLAAQGAGMPQLAGAFRAAPTSAGAVGIGKVQADYMRGADFQAKMAVLGPSERSTLVQTELQKLQALDPQAAQEVARDLAGQQFLANRADALKGLDPSTRAAGWQKALDTAGGPADKTAATAAALAKASEALTGADVSNSQILTRLQGALTSMQGTPGAARALEFVQKQGAKGTLGGLATVATLAGMGAKGLPTDLAGGAELSKNLIALGNSAPDVARLMGVTDAVLKAGKLGKVLKAFEFLGPVGDGIGAALDLNASIAEFERGDGIGGTAKLVQGAAGVTSMAAGIVMLSPAAGPGAPVVALGAAVVGGTAWVVDSIWGESDEESMLRQLGVWKG